MCKSRRLGKIRKRAIKVTGETLIAHGREQSDIQMLSDDVAIVNWNKTRPLGVHITARAALPPSFVKNTGDHYSHKYGYTSDR